MTRTATIFTADDLWAMGGEGRRELVKGEVREMAPAGFEHGVLIMRLARLMANHVEERQLGVVLGAETGFKLFTNPDTVRGAGIAFVSGHRIPAGSKPVNYWSGAPDLAVEVVSPNDALVDVEEKVDDYLSAGALTVWVVQPKRRTITIHRPNQNPLVLRETDTLSGDPVVPGFSCRIADLFA